MEDKSVREIIQATERVRMFAAAALCALTVFLFIAAVAELKSYRFIGSGVAATNTISVSGEGTVFAVPDTATFSVSVSETAKDVESAQTSATTKANAVIAYLKSQNIADTDIQTTDYEIQPQYDYSSNACTSGLPCSPSTPTLTGYQVSETLSVKVRDTSKAGSILAGVGSKGASSVSGLDFTVADEDSVEAQARDKAIAQAKDKADALAKSLGVSIVRVVGFSENGAPGPIYYAKSAGMTMDAAMPSVAPQIQTGQNKIVSDVTVTYEIQ